MRFYEIRHYNADFPGQTKILAYTAIILFKHKGKLLCYMKPLKNKSKSWEDPKNPDIYLPKGFIVCENDHLLYNEYYLALNFIDGLKNILGIKTRLKFKID
jgi:hypothetical protein